MARLYKEGKAWYCDININGVRIRKPLDTDRRLAESKLGRLIEQRNANHYSRPIQNMTWTEFKEKILSHIPHPVTNRLYMGAIQHLENHSNPQTVAQVTPSMLADAKAAWKKAGRGLYIVNRHVRCIKAMMHRAERWELVQKQDWTGTREDKEPKGRLTWYKVEELRKLLKVCKGMWLTVAILGARAGLRRSEIYYLSWDDVDFERKRIHVTPKPEWVPKDHERRWVPMPQDLFDYLSGLKRAGDYVFQEKGERPSLNLMSVYFKKLVRKAGLKGSIHALRHSYGSHLANAGVSLYIIKDLMGHSDVSMTQIYSHLAPQTLQESAAMLPKL